MSSWVNDWENPEVVEINRMPMHVTSAPYPTAIWPGMGILAVDAIA